MNAQRRMSRPGVLYKALRDRRGAAAVEMALVTPILLTMVFGVIEFGSLFFVRQTLVSAAREGARELAIQGATLTEAIAVTNNRLQTAGISGATVTGQNAYKGNGDSATAREVFIQVQLPTKNGMVGGDILKLFSSSSTMTVKITMRKEGELLEP